MLLQPLSHYVGQVFISLNLPIHFGKVQKADRPDLADVQCNGALQAAKLAGKPPRALAEQIVAALLQLPDSKHYFQQIAIAGPGFINFALTTDYLEKQVALQKQSDTMGFHQPEPQTVLLEYCSPNVAKDMHVGHLRNTVIGDAVKRMLLYAGHKVITDNHLGDWGLQLGQVFSELQRLQPKLPYFDAEFVGDYPTTPPITFAELCKIYPEASKKAKADPEELARAQNFTALLHQGHKGLRALWQHIVTLSVADMKQKLIDFGVEPMDTWCGESQMEEYIPWMMKDLTDKGLAEKIDGAIGIHVAQEGDKFEIPPLILEKTMGGVTYSTTDVATFYQRQKDFDPDVCIILTDYRQELHFERIYRASKRAGYATRMKFVHLMYGTIDGPDNKPFKTRDGGTPSFDYLMDLIFTKSDERLKEIQLDQKLSAEAYDTIKRQIGLAAMKFGDLINYRLSNYVFDLDKFVSFEGKTGPYLQYTAVRINSLIQKALAQDFNPERFAFDASHKEMALLLLEFPEAIETALSDYAPNVLCDYLFRLAQSGNRFYQNVHILSEPDPVKRGSALALLQQTAKILTVGLDLLGIKVPEHM
jgi:arginyl-tRNA synthetase